MFVEEVGVEALREELAKHLNAEDDLEDNHEEEKGPVHSRVEEAHPDQVQQRRQTRGYHVQH